MRHIKAIQLAQRWLNQRPQPKELDPKDVANVLSALGFIFIGKTGADTAKRWKHKCLKNDPITFVIPILKVAVGHKKGAKNVVRVDGIKVLLKALELRLKDEGNE